MPAAEELAARTISFLAADGYTSSVMKLPRPLLNELGRRLVEPGAKRSKIIDWLREEEIDTPERNLDRFAQRFREAYKVEWGKAADELLMAERAAAGDFDRLSYERVTRNRGAVLIAQKLATTNVADLDIGDIQRITNVLSSMDHGDIEAAKLALQERQADDRATKLQAEVDRIKLETEQKKARIEERVKGLQARIDDLENRAKRGGSIDPTIFQQIREELTGVAA